MRLKSAASQQSQLFDSHCHIHDIGAEKSDVGGVWLRGGITEPVALLKRARQAGVGHMICVGTNLLASQRAISFARRYSACYASIGLHPHEASQYVRHRKAWLEFKGLLVDQSRTRPAKIVAIGECGLDYHYMHSSKNDQIKVFKLQLELAQQTGLPLIFHVRDAFADFWPIVDQYSIYGGVVHSFTAGTAELENAIKRNFYIGFNGIMTFSKEVNQLAAARAVPLTKILLETDAPFLTPVPFRGKICEPGYVRETAKFLAALRQESVSQVVAVTTQNARRLFGV